MAIKKKLKCRFGLWKNTMLMLYKMNESMTTKA